MKVRVLVGLKSFRFFTFLSGFASVYGYRVSEIDEMLEVRKITGVCPQLDIHFDILTVEENLSIFASIKGIPPNDLIQEVNRTVINRVQSAFIFNLIGQNSFML